MNNATPQKLSAPKRSWISPFLGICFLAMSVTGILLFFHKKNGVVVTIHEWLGWGFVVAGAAHLLYNLRPLGSYMKGKAGWYSTATAVVLALIMGVVGLNRRREGPQRPAPATQNQTVPTPR